MKFCSVGVVKSNIARKSICAEHTYLFDSTQNKPTTKDEYFKLLPKARTLSIGSKDGIIDTIPIAGILNSRRYLLAVAAPRFAASYTANAYSSASFSNAHPGNDILLEMLGVFGRNYSFSTPHNARTLDFNVVSPDTKPGKGSNSNPLNFSESLMIITDNLENRNAVISMKAKTTHKYQYSRSYMVTGTTWTDAGYQFIQGFSYGLTSNANTFGARTDAFEVGTALNLGTIPPNSVTFIQAHYSRRSAYASNTNAPWSVGYGALSISAADNFSEQSAPYVGASKANEIINLSFSAMLCREGEDFLMIISDIGTDIDIIGTPVPNSTIQLTQLSNAPNLYSNATVLNL